MIYDEDYHAGDGLGDDDDADDDEDDVDNQDGDAHKQGASEDQDVQIAVKVVAGDLIEIEQ